MAALEAELDTLSYLDTIDISKYETVYISYGSKIILMARNNIDSTNLILLFYHFSVPIYVLQLIQILEN
jgi:hypothetical protein